MNDEELMKILIDLEKKVGPKGPIGEVGRLPTRQKHL